MLRPRRRLVVAALLVMGVLVLAFVVRLGLEWKQALDNVDAMIVKPVTLPTPPPGQPQEREATANRGARASRPWRIRTSEPPSSRSEIERCS